MRQITVPKETGLVTIQDAAKLFNRAVPTLRDWEKRGYIKPTWWMGRKYYALAQFYETGQGEVISNG